MKIDPLTIQFLQRYFDKIYVITIKRAVERQQQVKHQLDGLTFEFFYGVDKQNLGMDIIDTNKKHYTSKTRLFYRKNRRMMPGELACSLSHRNVYNDIIENGYRRVLIFEDDVVPLIKNLSLLPEVFNELPEDWDLVYLGYTKHETITSTLRFRQWYYKIISAVRLTKWNHTMISHLLPVPFSLHLKKAGFHDCTHAYAVTASSAHQLMSLQTPVAFNSDNLLSYAVLNGHLKAFVTEPKFFDQENMIDPEIKSFIHQ